MEKFTKLGLSKGLTDVLNEFGFVKPSEIQEKAIPLILAGKDVIGGSATGSGKTLAFSSAMLENLKHDGKIRSIVLTPTRELAEQVGTSIRDFGKNKRLNVLSVYGGVRIDSQIRKLHRADILVGTPGRVLDLLNRRALNLGYVKFLVLDEVDRMFDMGFRHDVEKIIRECPKDRQTMMFSATISPDIDYLADKYTRDAVEVSVESNVDPTKLKQVYYDVPDHKKFSLLVSLLRKEDSELVMVFCNTRRNSDFVTENLINSGIKAKVIHGGLEQKKRIRVLEEFHHVGKGVLVCTDVAARGLDIKGVSHVYNYDIPSDAKDYVHRIGRTARAGKNGKAVNILASRDYENFRNLMERSEFNIAPTDLPQLETVRIKISSGRGKRDSGRSSGGRQNGRSSGNRRQGSGNSSRRGSSSNRRQSSRDSPRRSSNNNRRGPRSQGSRKTSGYSRNRR